MMILLWYFLLCSLVGIYLALVDNLSLTFVVDVVEISILLV